MIKKLNAVLFVLLLLLLGMKLLKDKLAAPQSAPVEVVEEKSVRNAEFAPTVYYLPWVPYAVFNPITNRNGYLLDVLREIFPNARFVRLSGTVRNVVAKLSEDPSGVQCEYGDHLLLTNVVSAATPLLTREIAVYTERSNPWAYEGVESLGKLRLSICENDLDSKVLRAYAEKYGNDPKRLRIYKHDLRDDDEWRTDLQEKRIDGYVDTRVEDVKTSSLGSLAVRLLWGSVSAPIDTVEVRFSVSNRDPAYAKQLIDAYERGIREMEASGELRRLRDYYGIRK